MDNRFQNDFFENLPGSSSWNVQTSNEGTSAEGSSGVKLQDPPDISVILSTDESLITASSHNVGVINAACQKVLKDIEQQLLHSLKKNRKEQEIIINFLNSNNRSPYLWNRRSRRTKCIGMPYFKDPSGFPPPVNKDVLKKKENKKILPFEFIEPASVWSISDATNLIKAVTKLTEGNDTVDPNSVDWLRISATELEGKFSPSECKSKWIMNLRPSINRRRWKIREVKQLEKIAEKNDCEDWDKIAEELSTGRTSFQCCVQYHTYKGSNKGKWTEEEDGALMRIINRFRIKDVIPWKKVAWHFECRSLRQCLERYVYHIGDIKKGSFSQEEDIAIVFLATKLKNFGEVAKHIPLRTAPQVRSRYEYLVNMYMRKFTKEEDDLLTKLVAQYPRNWGKISESFKNRSKLQCRKRWLAIQQNVKIENDEFVDTLSEEDEVIGNEKTSSKKSSDALIDSKNLNKKLNHLELEPVKQIKKQPKEYVDLINYHKHCYKFLFGPKIGLPGVKEEFDWLLKKFKVSMKNLHLHPSKMSQTFDLSSFSSNCEFDDQDLSVLGALRYANEPQELYLLNKIMPPNYITLVGLRTLLLGWSKMRNLSSSYVFEGGPTERSSRDRLLCSDAKKLFKSRMKSLFTFPIIMSKISQEKMVGEIVRKPKVRKQTKPLSKRKRKLHAKAMSEVHRKWVKEQSQKLSETVGRGEAGERPEAIEREEAIRLLEETRNRDRTITLRESFESGEINKLLEENIEERDRVLQNAIGKKKRKRSMEATQTEEKTENEIDSVSKVKAEERDAGKPKRKRGRKAGSESKETVEVKRSKRKN